MASQSAAERANAHRRRTLGLRQDLTSFWFLLPILAVFVVLFAVPLVQTIIYSMTDFNGYSLNMHYVGWKNYHSVFTDASTMQGLVFTILYAVAQTVLVTIFAIPLAVTLNRKFWGRNFARSLFFFFSVPSLAIMGMVWKYIFSPMKSGVFNTVLGVFGLGPVPWLSNSTLARCCVIFIAVWAQIGWHATLYLAFLQSIPEDLYEQATVDGASSRQQFVHITLPQLIPGIVTSSFLLMSGGLKVYDLPYTMTKGGPGYSTYTVTQSIIQQGIGQSQYGLGSALAVLFTVATALVVFAQMGAASLISRRFQ
ncbi:sugar ABC transporter permease [Bifidobacterium sp. B4081]|uniref:carbohydrate ABC transporter permease n=1 Tax=unclassified Bifidobacterium TaxID=2608897 RepID=UPI00226A8FF8|nr:MULTISPECIES: sugar ABC transporter permease [unclassified Bifidobacterium]MCX8644332.1 sugar ABC transporter permease [Bifidobacterium sp. B4077]MCX8646144.1 sugar ABC transporter permease [Bifidobacterium sp. B4081]MCX8668316.1 sugar ABC transporter permease [Bifidobacterium sp. B3998]